MSSPPAVSLLSAQLSSTTSSSFSLLSIVGTSDDLVYAGTLIVAAALFFIAAIHSITILWPHYSTLSAPPAASILAAATPEAAALRRRCRTLVLHVLWMVPIISFTSIITVVSESTGYWLAPMRNIYEAYVIHSFFMLIETMMGGEVVSLQRFEKDNPKYLLASPPCCCCCKCICKPTTLSPFIYRLVGLAIKQFPVMVLAMAVLEVILYLANADRGIIGLDIVNTLSALLALYGLFVLRRATSGFLARFNVTRKFLAVAIGLSLVIFQKFFFSILTTSGAISSNDSSTTAACQAENWESYMLVLELWLLDFFNAGTFPVGEFDQLVVGETGIITLGTATHAPATTRALFVSASAKKAANVQREETELGEDP